MTTLTKPCLNCGKTIIKQSNRSLKDWENRTKYCSRKCGYVCMRISMVGNKYSVGKNTGHRSEEIKDKIRQALWKGGLPKCLICNKLLSAYEAKHCKRHRPHTLQMRINKSKACRRGENNHLWRGGITPINRAIRGSLEYKLWRESVFKLDNWTCVWCGQRGGNLEADHIKPFAYYPELRFEVSNGRTLCISCHKKTETHSQKK